MIDYHVHTSLCNHASGTMEQYVQAAVAKGLDTICFLDHLTFQEAGRDNAMLPREVPMYVDTARRLARQYQGRIDVRVGLEVDFSADHVTECVAVVNTFDLDEDGQIVDYGNYTSVRNLSTLDKIKINDECVIIDTEAGRFDYQGTLDSTTIPWNISIRYYLNRVEFPAEALAGQTGALEIVIAITENTDCTVAFFDNYALQISMSLDTDVCRNVVASDATIASSGDSKQVSFVVLPGNRNVQDDRVPDLLENDLILLLSSEEEEVSEHNKAPNKHDSQ